MTTPGPSSSSLAVVTRVQDALAAPGAPFAVTETPRGPRYLAGPAVLRDFLTATRAHGELTFLVHGESRLTFAEHYAAAVALAHHYVDHYRLRPGDRVAIAMRNLPAWQVAFWATQLAGLIAVPLNAWWTARELGRALDDCTPRLVVADQERAARIEPWLAGQAERPWLLTAGADADAERGERVERFEELPPPVAGRPAPEVAISPEDDATIVYTSGTTGRPKGVVATQSSWCAATIGPRFFAATAALAAGREPGQPSAPTVLMTYPFFHVAAFTALFPLMAGGGTAVLMDRWDPTQALELIDRHQVTTFNGVPTTALALLDAAEAGDPADATALAADATALAATDAAPLSLTVISTGGAAAPPGLARRIARRFGGRVEPRNGYGLTETCGGVTANVGARYLEHPDSIGRRSPALAVRIAGPDGAPRPEGEVGELWLRGQAVFRGYWNDPAATAAAFAGPWFRTGDLARVRDGEVYLVDRLKDLVIRGGENVYCGEVEGVLLDHPAVADAAVLGVPHPLLAEEVAAVVRLRGAAHADAEELRRHVAARLAAFKVPAHVLLHPLPLPRNATGKLLKHELRAQLAAAADAPART
ncbi:long-chain fatty acid--CoA ligase [Kitasatospora nipponensis]|uniref:Long-chain fatty acid--CoA ligase n=1 Tax=Kitasatospora nipponensis TaxID=258049 RepID=A0ABP4GF63_9ACTN